MQLLPTVLAWHCGQDYSVLFCLYGPLCLQSDTLQLKFRKLDLCIVMLSSCKTVIIITFNYSTYRYYKGSLFIKWFSSRDFFWFVNLLFLNLKVFVLLVSLIVFSTSVLISVSLSHAFIAHQKEIFADLL